MRINILTLLLPLLPVAAVAQTQAPVLHKDIEVEQKSTPTRHDATRISLLPTVTLPAISDTPLPYSDRVVQAPVPNVISTLAPAAWTDPDADPDSRGYVVAGLFPVYFNADVSAGYRFVDNDRTRLSAWGQYDGSAYRRGRYISTRRAMWHDHQLSLGADLRQAVGTRGTLDAGLSYTWGRADMWQQPSIARMSRTVNIGALDLAYASRANALDYNASLRVERLGFSHLRWDEYLIPAGLTAPEIPDPLHQTLFRLGGEASIASGQNSDFSLRLGLDLLNSATHNTVHPPYTFYSMTPRGGDTDGLLRLNPRWVGRTGSVTVTLGAEVGMAFTSGTDFIFSPDVSLAWTPTQIFGIELKAGGGSTLNPLSELYGGVTRWLNPTVAYGHSNVPYDLEGKLTFGPFLNTTLEVTAGYARADDWLMPVDWSFMPPGGALFRSLDVKGHRFGIALGYDNGHTLSAKVSWTTAPSGEDKAFYQWRDRARNVVEASVRVRPLRHVTVNAGFELRSGRAMYAYAPVPDVPLPGVLVYPSTRVGLGTEANLSLGASLRCTRTLTLFVTGQNLLSSKWMEIGPRPVQGINALVGASYRF